MRQSYESWLKNVLQVERDWGVQQVLQGRDLQLHRLWHAALQVWYQVRLWLWLACFLRGFPWSYKSLCKYFSALCITVVAGDASDWIFVFIFFKLWMGLLCSLILMGGELRSHVQLAGVTWVMFLKVRDSKCLRMNVTVSTVFQSSLSPLCLLLSEVHGDCWNGVPELECGVCN